MFFLSLILGANAKEPATADSTVSRHSLAVALAAKEKAAKEAAVQADLVDRREQEQRLELLKTCKVGATGLVFGSAIAGKCDVAFASAEAIRDGQPINFKARGASVSVSANQYYGFGYGGYGFHPGLYQNIAYGGVHGQAGTYDPTAEILRRLTSEVGELKNDTAALGEVYVGHINTTAE